MTLKNDNSKSVSLPAAAHPRGVLARLSADKRGSTAIIFGLMIAPVMMLVGMAVDYSRMVTVNTNMQTSLDAAVLAGARAVQSGSTAGNPTAIALSASQHYLDAVGITHTVAKPVLTSNTLTSGNTVYTLTSTAWVNTPFLSVGSMMQTKPAAADAPTACSASWWICQKIVTTSTATIQSGNGNNGYNIETSMIFDLSGSMGFDDGTGTGTSKVAALRAAAQQLASILVWADQSVYTSKIAITPYSMGVNVGSYANAVRGPLSGGNSTTPGGSSYTFTNAYTQQQGNDFSNAAAHAVNASGNYVTTPGYYYVNAQHQLTYNSSTCVSERTGAHAYDDVAPSISYVGLNYVASNNPCLAPTIQPLTNDTQTIATQIGNLQAGGSTAAQVGLAWGWYLLSPNFNYLWPAANRAEPYIDLTTKNAAGNNKVKKIAILMTDGGWNSTYCNGVISADSIPGSNSESTHINCNANNGGTFSQAVQLCTNMKAQGIEFYTIAFLVGTEDPVAVSALQTCATDASHYYLATDGGALLKAFTNIATRTSHLLITK